MCETLIVSYFAQKRQAFYIYCLGILYNAYFAYIAGNIYTVEQNTRDISIFHFKVYIKDQILLRGHFHCYRYLKLVDILDHTYTGGLKLGMGP
jgi:hypothetical protein